MRFTRWASTIEQKRAWAGFIFILPWLIGFIYFFLLPFMKSVLFTFSNIQIGTEGMTTTFVGLRNYRATFLEDPDNVRLIFSSLGDMLYQVSIIVILSLFIAVILNQKFRGRLLARAIFALPIIISSGVIIYLLKYDVLAQSLQGNKAADLFQSSELVQVMIQSGFNPKLVAYFTGIVNGIYELVWKSGVQILLFLAALQSIPGYLYEASSIEGATKWESFWKITFPMISPFILVTTVYSIIDTFTDFENPVMKKIFSLVSNMHYETVSTLGIVYFLLVLAVIGIVTAIISRNVFYIEK
ncbi:lactose ABC transporter permease [Paenibacillus baekrokdamisoli]|uniref:Lactose ABC transporter permease n=1 Tax=Paenibacillus baekrokdamisoli TaxID=1712516 RepID=A0A3G9IKH0_9BACL|nr:sugar ABC transporter permease [Paenibacillus baekrokdamisoli]MBB3069370.1 ABC-type sugar transport system permease subunit [Paenibacillus baekrokdamisoli]BBH18662.1 lactose ABC transporter permease [Paenibacillus baekrokdamisoli]